MNQDLKYWVTLSTNLNIGAKSFKKLNQVFDSMEEVWEASSKKLREKGIEEKIIRALEETKEHKNPEEEIKKIKSLNINAINIHDENYPSILKEIPDAPALLYYKGDLSFNEGINIAVVGSRKYTPYGEKVVERIVGPLATEGMVIVSGLALGIDALAHKEALNANSRTIAVLGNGLDSIYPSSNRFLAEKIIKENGVLISEFPIGTPSFKQNFPFRNRIIAGLSLGTLVVEAAVNSGSLITARCALDYNREVFATPGGIFSSNSEGPNNLIKLGAKTVTSAEDIFIELNIKTEKNHNQAKKIIPDSIEEKVVIETLGEISMHIDKIKELAKLDIVKLSQTLVLMEMKGKIKNLGGNIYCIVK